VLYEHFIAQSNAASAAPLAHIAMRRILSHPSPNKKTWLASSETLLYTKKTIEPYKVKI